MANKVYENFIIEDKIEDMLTTKVDMMQFLTADYSLSEAAGMIKKIHVYSATGDVEDLAMGVGNSEFIEVTFDETPYEVGTTQGRFAYYDEEAMTDPNVVEVGVKGVVAKMTNDLTAKAIAEFGNASLEVTPAKFDFAAVVDAIAKLNTEDESGIFLLINPAEHAALRKNLGDDLKYVEAFARSGYIGTVCGAPVYVSEAVPENEAYLATKDAVTAFIKKGVEIEQERDANVRKNTVYARKVAVVALTDATKAVKITLS